MQIKLDIDARPLANLYRGLEVFLANRQELLSSVGQTLFNANQERHRQGVAPDGTPWKPLSPSVTDAIIQRRLNANKRKGPPTAKAVAKATDATRSRKVLWDTGEMLGNSLNSRVEGDTLRLGFSMQYAAYHHYGTSSYTIRPKNGKALVFNGMARRSVKHPGLAARPLLGFPDGDRDAVVNLLDDNIRAIVQRIKG